MLSFTLSNWSPSVQVSLPENLSRDQLLSFRPFKEWLETLKTSLHAQSEDSHAFHKDAYKLQSITVQAVDFFGSGSRIGFVKLTSKIANGNRETLPASILLRGGSVAMLMLLQPDDTPTSSDEWYAITTIQPRIAIGSLVFCELPAGMLDDSATLSGAAAKEIQEEIGMTIHEDELIDLTSLALRGSQTNADDTQETLRDAMYPSAGGCDEFMTIFLHRTRVPREQLESWKGKLTGLRDEGEKITLKLVKYQDLWRVGARDSKVLAACALYDGLRREGKL